jgi:DHA1 family tetracycline resistance protein-like MFS transporter
MVGENSSHASSIDRSQAFEADSLPSRDKKNGADPGAVDGTERADGLPRSAALGWLLSFGSRLGYREADRLTLFVVLATFTYLGIILTLAQGFLVRRLSGRMSEGAMAGGGAVTAIAGFLLLAVAAQRNDFTLLLEAMALEVMGFAFVNPSLQSLLSRRSDPREQGSILGLGQSMTSLARILGPVFGVSFFARRADLPYWAAAVLMVLGLGMIVVAARSGRDFVEVAE